MNKYLLLVPIIGAFLPPYIDDWDKFVKENPILFSVSLIIQIVSGAIFTALVS
jgi:hypothetical protein